MRGSIRWWRCSPSTRQRRRSVVEVATAAAGKTEQRDRLAAIPGARPRRSRCHRRAPRRSTRRSPPRFTQAPRAPAARSSAETMSAARPLPMPPGSNPLPAGAAPSPGRSRCRRTPAGRRFGPGALGPGSDRTCGHNLRGSTGPSRVGSNAPALSRHPSTARSTSSTVSAATRTRRTRGEVQPARVAAGPKPAPEALEPLDPGGGRRRPGPQARRRRSRAPASPSPGSGAQLPPLEVVAAGAGGAGVAAVVAAEVAADVDAEVEAEADDEAEVGGMGGPRRRSRRRRVAGRGGGPGRRPAQGQMPGDREGRDRACGRRDDARAPGRVTRGGRVSSVHARSIGARTCERL